MAESSKIVLVVDDEEEIRASLTNALRFWGYAAEEAESGEEALDAALRIVPSLVLLDVMMPGMGGLEVLRALRENPDTSHIPVVLVTAVGDYELGAEWTPETVAARIGVGPPEAVIDKPIDLRTLRDCVAGLLEA